MTEAETSLYSTFLNDVANAAAGVSLQYFKKSIEVTSKGPKLNTDFDPVTIADKRTEKVIREMIRSRFPDHNIIGEEEEDELKNSEYSWIIDPIDGTRAYISGIPTWGTLVALQKNGKSVIGMLDQPYLKERFIGTPMGAFMNGQKINCRPCSSIFNATISTTDPLQLFSEDDERDRFFRVAAGAKMMRNGFDCYAYAMVACGFMDVVIESGLNAHDIQALIPIIEGAGGLVTNWQGETVREGGQVVACGDKRLHEQVIGLLNTSI